MVVCESEMVGLAERERASIRASESCVCVLFFSRESMSTNKRVRGRWRRRGESDKERRSHICVANVLMPFKQILCHARVGAIGARAKSAST